MVHGKALKLAVAGVVTIAALATVTSAVVIAGASGPSTTYYACLKSGKLSEVGTTSPTKCKAGSTIISWNSQGPSGPPGANGVNGSPGSVGPQGPAGPGPIYIADNSNGTMSGSIDTPDVLATNVNGFDVHFSCAANIEFDTAAVSATLTSSDPSIQSVTTYESSLVPGGSPLASSQSGAQLHAPMEFAIIDNIEPSIPVNMFTEGYVVANSGGIASQPEAGFWFSLYLQFQLTSGTAGNCSVTGTLVPVSGNRLVPLPFHLP